MDLSKYKLFYVNGCSHVEGGGLEEKSLRPVYSIQPLYEKKFGITWNNRKEINFATRLSEIIGIPCINEGKSGGSADRVVRMTYDFLFDNWERKDEMFLILEKPDPGRSDIWLNQLKSYFIVNTHKDERTGNLKVLKATREHWNAKFDPADWLERHKFQSWFENHYNFTEKFKQDEKWFIGLYSFCKLNNIKVFVMMKNEIYFDECFEKDDIIIFDGYKPNTCDIETWVQKNGMTIYDEMDGNVDDQHPGYYGHIEYAKELAKFLGYKGELKVKEPIKICQDNGKSLI
jgi:hypothetical protein